MFINTAALLVLFLPEVIKTKFISPDCCAFANSPVQALPARASLRSGMDTLPPNPPPLRHPSGEVRRRPRKQSWEGPVSLEQAQADYDFDENTPVREASRAARRLALVALKTDSIPLCRHFTRGVPCKTRLCKQRHETSSVAEDLTVSRATSQRLAALAMKSTEKEVKYIVDDPAANAALAAQRAIQVGGHGAAASRADLRLGHKLWCDPCSRGFDKSKQYDA